MKYIIEIKPEYEDSFKGLMILGAKDSNLLVDTLAVENLEELNSDYINEHFGDLQDTAYQRGFEDGEAQSKRGCEGCQYQTRTVFDEPCIRCSNAYKSKWKAKRTDDKIKVRDEVVWTEDENVVIVVTSIYTTDNMEWCDGFCKDGKVYSILTENARKTGRHFDIEKILEEMRND